MSTYTRLDRQMKRLRSDEGMALMTVVLISVVLFLLVTTILLLTQFRSTQVARAEERSKVRNVAEAGINQYMYKVSQAPSTYRSNPPVLNGTMQDGSWSVTAVSMLNGSRLMLTSVGTLPNGETKTIKAKIKMPGFGDYSWILGTGDVTFGAATTVDGQVWVDGNVYNYGLIKRLSKAGIKNYDNNNANASSVHYPGGWQNGTKPDFSQLTMDMDTIKTQATLNSTYRGPSSTTGDPHIGYHLTLQGDRVMVEKIRSIQPTYSTGVYKMGDFKGRTTTEAALDSTETISIPADPKIAVMYFDDNIYVEGTYSRPLTIATSGRAYFTRNLTRTGSDAPLGIMSSGDLIWPVWFKNMPQSLTVESALLSQNGKVGFEKFDDYNKTLSGGNASNPATYYPNTTLCSNEQKKTGTLIIRGSICAKAGNLGFYASDLSRGFIGTRQYLYDEVLYNMPPPMWPTLPGESLSIESWLE